jgi:hypothetical protein
MTAPVKNVTNWLRLHRENPEKLYYLHNKYHSARWLARLAFRLHMDRVRTHRIPAYKPLPSWSHTEPGVIWRQVDKVNDAEFFWLCRLTVGQHRFHDCLRLKARHLRTVKALAGCKLRAEKDA